jgi:hypothetical protein
LENPVERPPVQTQQPGGCRFASLTSANRILDDLSHRTAVGHDGVVRFTPASHEFWRFAGPLVRGVLASAGLQRLGQRLADDLPGEWPTQVTAITTLNGFDTAVQLGIVADDHHRQTRADLQSLSQHSQPGSAGRAEVSEQDLKSLLLHEVQTLLIAVCENNSNIFPVDHAAQTLTHISILTDHQYAYL